MNKPKVSVIIPVYNTEAYLDQTVHTIMDQTLREIEIILINDGSTDRSAEIIAHLAAADPRIRIHTQVNKGPSEARNAGLDLSEGEFIYLMDSDDLLEPDTLERCYARCQTDQLDFVFFDAESFGAAEASESRFDYFRAKYFKASSYHGTDLLREMLDRRCFRASPCLSLIRTSYLEKLGLRFYPGILHEDELFTPQLYLGATRVGGIERSFFRRRLRPGSIMGSTFSQRNLDGYLRVIAELKAYGAAHGGQAKMLTGRLIRLIIIAVLHNSWRFSEMQRMKLACKLLYHYPTRVPLLTLGVMLVKSPLNKLRGR